MMTASESLSDEPLVRNAITADTTDDNNSTIEIPEVNAEGQQPNNQQQRIFREAFRDRGNNLTSAVHKKSLDGGMAEEDAEDVSESSKSLFFCMVFESPFLSNKNKAAAFSEIRFQAKFTVVDGDDDDNKGSNQGWEDSSNTIRFDGQPSNHNAPSPTDVGPNTAANKDKVVIETVPDEAYSSGFEFGLGITEEGEDGGGTSQHDSGDGTTALKLSSSSSTAAAPLNYHSILEPIPFEVEGAFIMHDELLVIKHTDSVTERVVNEDGEDGDGDGGKRGEGSTLKSIFNTRDASKSKMNPTRALLRVGLGEEIVVPNKFQKIIDIILRFKARGLAIRPNNMLERVASDADVPVEEGGAKNFYQGYRLVKGRCFMSPDGDEIMLKVHMPSVLMLGFAESRGLFLPTNTYSYAGGRSLMYSRKTEMELRHSVERIVRGEGAEGGRDGGGGANGGRVHVPEDRQGVGFIINKPVKQRIIHRFIREPWRFGGCGIQVNEMMSKKIIIKHFFPLHSKAQIKDKKLDEWASFKQSPLSPMAQNIATILDYFGEEVALYFYWIKQYNSVWSIPAVIGVAAGVLALVFPQHQYAIKGGFAILCVGVAVFWNIYWLRLEMIFVADHQLQDVDEQATLRDLYEGEERLIDDQMLYDLKFQNPPAFISKSDGSLVELHYPPWKRNLIRFCISYPLIIFLAALMTGLLCLNTYYRLEFEEDHIQYLCSFIAVAISQIFNLVFGYVAEATSHWENNRTDEEEEYQNTIKKFFHYFLSSYFSLLSLIFWPSKDTNDSIRLEALELQMITNCVVMPFIQDVTETLLPVMKARLRINIDNNPDSLLTGLCNALSGYTIKDYPQRCINSEAEALWVETQKEPLPSMGNEFLEIAIQFGYMTMFAVAFPWAAIAAFVFNLAEIRVDAHKIIYSHQRPFAKPVKSIGAWRFIFAIITLCSIFTNTFIISIMTDALRDVTAKEDVSDATRYQFFVGFQYTLVGVAVVVWLFTPLVPDTLAKQVVKQNILMTRHARLQNKERRVMRLAADKERRLRRGLGGEREWGGSGENHDGDHHHPVHLRKRDGPQRDESGKIADGRDHVAAERSSTDSFSRERPPTAAIIDHDL